MKLNKLKLNFISLLQLIMSSLKSTRNQQKLTKSFTSGFFGILFTDILKSLLKGIYAQKTLKLDQFKIRIGLDNCTVFSTAIFSCISKND